VNEPRSMATVHPLRPRARVRLVAVARPAPAETQTTTSKVVDLASAARRLARRPNRFDFDTSPGGNAA
jgi:hypothetical protein